MLPPSDPVRVAIDYTLRQDRGRLIAALTAVIGDFELAEECLQDAVVAALKTWPASGVPKSRRGWLLQVARRKALDRFRRAKSFAQKAAQIAVLEQAESEAPADTHDIPDHRLRLIFTCCHPALDAKTRVALTLRTLGGLSTEEVARAFLDKPATMGQRLARARRKISKAGIPFEIPDADQMSERIASVLAVIYLIFNEGYAATAGECQIRLDLCDEAIFLARLMQGFCPDQPEVSGLLALILLSHARRAARIQDGVYVPLSIHDRGLWDRKLISEGQSVLETALGVGQIGPYQLQASVSALHCEATTDASTDWLQIAALYRLLAQIKPSAVVRLNLAVALSNTHGPEHALGCLDQLNPDLQDYQPYHAARADLLAKLGRNGAAKEAYDRAHSLSLIASERMFLAAKRDALEGEKGPGTRPGQSNREV